MAVIGDKKKGSGSSRWAVRATMFLSLALVAAGGAALLLTRWVNTRIDNARVPIVKVVVAAVDLPVGTRIAKEHLTAVDWPRAARPNLAMEDPAACEGKIVAVRVFKGEPLLTEKLVSGKAGDGLAALLPEGSRAVSVRVDDVVGVAGFIHPGDVVDVIVTMKQSETNPIYTSKIILQRIKVLAVGKEVDAGPRGDKVLPATVATLQVDSLQAERLALAASKGQLLLALRSASDDEQVETRGVAPAALLAASEPPADAAAKDKDKDKAKNHRPKPRIAAKPPEPEKQMIEIMRGDLFERRGFDKKAGEQ